MSETLQWQRFFWQTVRPLQGFDVNRFAIEKPAWHVAWTKINALKHSLKHGLDSRDHPQGDGSSPIAAPPAPLPTSGTRSAGAERLHAG